MTHIALVVLQTLVRDNPAAGTTARHHTEATTTANLMYDSNMWVLFARSWYYRGDELEMDDATDVRPDEVFYSEEFGTHPATSGERAFCVCMP